MTWWFWDAVFLLSSLSYRQQRWTETASRGPWGPSLALGPGTKPVLDVADFMDRSTLACLSAGCCLSPLCTVQEEVNPLVDWVCLSVISDTQINRNKFFWSYVLSSELVSGCGCMCVFACFGAAFPPCWVSGDKLPFTRPELAGEITMTNMLLLQVFFKAENFEAAFISQSL